MKPPNEVYETLRYSSSDMIWCTVSENEVIGPCFFEKENVTGSTYKRMLHYFSFPRLQGYPEDIIYHPYVALLHDSLEVREYLERKLPNRWMGRGGSIEWPSHSPDLIPCQYVLWIYIKDKAYRESSWMIAELKTKIHQTNSDYRSRDNEKCFEKYDNLVETCTRTGKKFNI